MIGVVHRRYVYFLSMNIKISEFLPRDKIRALVGLINVFLSFQQHLLLLPPSSYVISLPVCVPSISPESCMGEGLSHSASSHSYCADSVLSS